MTSTGLDFTHLDTTDHDFRLRSTGTALEEVGNNCTVPWRSLLVPWIGLQYYADVVLASARFQLGTGLPIQIPT